MAQRQIGGNLFTVTPLPAMRSFVLQSKLAPALSSIIGSIGSLAGGSLAETDVGALAPAVAGFFSKLGPDELEQVTRQLLGDATMDGKPLFSPAGDPFNVFMAGRTMDTWKLLWFAVEVNYPDFFGLLGAAASSRGEKVTVSKSGASNTSPGLAGVSS